MVFSEGTSPGEGPKREARTRGDEPNVTWIAQCSEARGPRTRGDEPQQERLVFPLLWRGPRTSGDEPSAGQWYTISFYVVPARAGMNRYVTAKHSLRPGWSPHARG